MMVAPQHTPRNTTDELFAIWHDRTRGEELCLIRWDLGWNLAIYGCRVWPEQGAKSPRLVGILCSAPELAARHEMKTLDTAPDEEVVVVWDRGYAGQKHLDLARRTPNGWLISRNGTLVADRGVRGWLCAKRELLCATMLGIDASGAVCGSAS